MDTDGKAKRHVERKRRRICGSKQIDENRKFLSKGKATDYRKFEYWTQSDRDAQIMRIERQRKACSEKDTDAAAEKHGLMS